MSRPDWLFVRAQAERDFGAVAVGLSVRGQAVWKRARGEAWRRPVGKPRWARILTMIGGSQRRR